MKIPPGEALSSEKGVLLEDLLKSLEESAFSGLCTLSAEEVTSSLVFRGGRCILAEHHQEKGNAAWKSVLTMKSAKVDAIVHSLSAKQIDRSLESNPSYLVAFPRKEAKGEAVRSTTVIRPVSPKGRPDRQVKVSTVVSGSKAEDGKNQPAAEVHDLKAKVPGKEVDKISIESLKGLKDSFKADVAGLLKELDLEHLIVDEEEKGNVKKSSKDAGKEFS